MDFGNYGDGGSGSGGPGDPPGGGHRQAAVGMPSANQMGGQQPVPFVRYPFFPTAPWYSTNPNVGYMTIFYSTALLSTDADFTIGTETVRNIQFDIPVRVIAINGASARLAAPADGTITTDNMNLMYLFRMEYAQGERLHVTQRLAENVVGTAQRPGEIGGHGFNVDQGSTVVVGITPLVNDIRINVTLHCLQMRAPRNFSIR